MTISPVIGADLEPLARRLAAVNHDFENSIIRTYWFRDAANREIRLVHIDTDSFAKPGPIRPFYFGASTTDGEFTPPSAIALITPDEETKSSLPDGWGEWDDATVWEWD